MTKILTGRKQIQMFVGRAWEVILKWKRRDGFPMQKLDGVWESDTTLILEWRKGQILKE